MLLYSPELKKGSWMTIFSKNTHNHLRLIDVLKSHLACGCVWFVYCTKPKKLQILLNMYELLLPRGLLARWNPTIFNNCSWSLLYTIYLLGNKWCICTTKSKCLFSTITQQQMLLLWNNKVLRALLLFMAPTQTHCLSCFSSSFRGILRGRCKSIQVSKKPFLFYAEKRNFPNTTGPWWQSTMDKQHWPHIYYLNEKQRYRFWASTLLAV